MTKTISKNITTYELATMVANGFSGVDRRFTELDKKFEEIDMRFDAVDERFTKLDNAVFSLDTKVGEIDKRLKKVEDALEPLLMGYGIMQKEIRNLNLRVEKLEQKATGDKS